MTRNLVLAITGASGAVYALRLLDVLLAADCRVHLAISPAGQAVLKQELGIEVDVERFRPDGLLAAFAGLGNRQPGNRPPPAADRLVYYHHRDFMAPIASGSFLTGGMVICPCSGGTLSALAQGSSTNLIHRAADVHLKEGRKLIIVPRETPLSLIHIDNLRRCAEAGVVVLPASPGFYHGVASVADLVDFVVARICDQLGVEHQLMRRWGE